MKLNIFVLLLAVLMLLTSCGKQTETLTEALTEESTETSINTSTKELETAEIPSATSEIFAMDTYMTIACYGDQCDDALSDCIAEIKRLDALLSVGNADSEISLLNAFGRGLLSNDTAVMVTQAIELYRSTEGAFDITVYPLMELWGFTTGAFVVPDSDKLSALLAKVGTDKLLYDADTQTLTLGEEQGIDLGGIAKGYTSGRLLEIFAEYELVSGYVSLGGNVQCYQTKVDGSLWRVGIQNPFEPEDSSSLLGILSVSDRAVITSGAYERYFVDEVTGETYHHILDPATGYPVQNGLSSVTIVSENGMLADGLSTACYVMGLEQAITYWQEYGDNFDMILMTEDKEVYVTEPISDSFTSDFNVTVIQKEE